MRVGGQSSLELRKTLFNSYVLPIFTWLFPFFPLFTRQQQNYLNHFYYTCLKRIYFCLHWQDPVFSFLCNEISLEDRCKIHWEKYFLALSDKEDGALICEEANLNLFREAWRDKSLSVSGFYRSKRFVQHTSILEKILQWCSDIPSTESIPVFSPEEMLTLANFPDTF